MDSKQEQTAELSIKVIRKDGTVEDHGTVPATVEKKD